jgi:hypothetical protein
MPRRETFRTAERALALLGAVAFAASCSAGSARGALPCVSPGTCGRGYECLANRCAPLGGDPVRADTRRIVVGASRIAVVSSRASAPPRAATASDRELPGAVRFGSAELGASALIVSFASAFEPVWARAREVDSAFLILEPMPGAAVGTADIEVAALRVSEKWDAAKVSWRSQPRAGLPSSRGLARSSPPSTLRIDVTELVRYERTRARQHHGIAVRAAGGSDLGAAFATGATLGVGPRLEVYLR